MDRQALTGWEAVFSEDYNHDITDVQNPTESLEHRMVMKSPWKLILPKEEGRSQTFEESGGGQFINYIEGPELYHIVDDPHESNNVASQHPEIVQELEQLIEDWWEPEF